MLRSKLVLTIKTLTAVPAILETCKSNYNDWQSRSGRMFVEAYFPTTFPTSGLNRLASNHNS